MFNYTIPSLYFVSFLTSQLLFVVRAHADAAPVTHFKHEDFKVGYLISNFPEIVTFPSRPPLSGPLIALTEVTPGLSAAWVKV